MIKKTLHRFLQVFFPAVLLFNSGWVHAQEAPSVSTTVNKDKILLGEQLDLTLRYRFPGGSVNVSQPFVPDTFPHFEVVERLKADSSITGNSIQITQVIRVTSFDSGHWTIPSFTLTAGKKSFRSDTIGIDVQTVPIEGTEYNEIRDILEVETPPVNWKLWLAIGLSVLIIGLLIAWYLKNRKRTVKASGDTDSRLSPYDQAMQEFKKLKAQQIPGNGEIKAYYSKGYDILRVYLTRKYSMKVMQGTTDDILINLKGKYLQAEPFSRMAEVLRITDAVKFAKYSSSKEEALASIDTLEKTIEALHQQKS